MARSFDGSRICTLLPNRCEAAPWLPGSTWSYLDLTALGRQEAWEDWPEGYPQTPPYEWWIWHDEVEG